MNGLVNLDPSSLTSGEMVETSLTISPEMSTVAGRAATMEAQRRC